MARIFPVSIQRASYPHINIESLLAPLGGIGSFVKKGDRVLLKMNLLSARHPEKAITTHPAVVREVAEAVIQAGSTPFIADSPAGSFSKKNLKKAYALSGIEAIAEEKGIELNRDTRSCKMHFPEAHRLKSAPVCRFIEQADTIIALPKLKTHSFQYMTLACKIMYGVIPGLSKAAYHARFPSRTAFADMLLDILTRIKPSLYIMDGILGMQGQGPANGDPIHLGILMASTNPVAMDIAVCESLGIEPVGIPALKRAKLRNMWPDAIDYPLLSPSDVYNNGFAVPNTADHLINGKKLSQKQPVITDRCVGCGECETICPKEAIRIKNDMAEVIRTRCICCYCCHEVCPEDAILLENTTH